MRKGLMGMVAGVMLATSVMAQEAVAPVPGIEAVISGQMRAFEGDDFETAFDYASPGIQGMFRSADNFGAMVQRGYPMVWRHDDVQFGDLRDVEGVLWQRVFVTDPGGTVHALDYRMEQIDGDWRIAGVQIARLPGVSA
ncbi:DUF4864 domain-containing protein [Salipiger sp.]|uniref:DUF4864 domain-containing protein n=1 Tax=Salipiger sp. TaxID=2078585 RepID=UPI003A96FA47